MIKRQNKDNFHDVYLSVSNLFNNKKINYSYEDYEKHLELTKEFRNSIIFFSLLSLRMLFFNSSNFLFSICSLPLFV